MDSIHLFLTNRAIGLDLITKADKLTKKCTSEYAFMIPLKFIFPAISFSWPVGAFTIREFIFIICYPKHSVYFPCNLISIRSISYCNRSERSKINCCMKSTLLIGIFCVFGYKPELFK